MLLIRRLGDEARFFQSFQAVGKNVGRNSFGRLLQFSIGHITPEQVPNHKQRPLVPNQIERACDSTGRALKAVSFRVRLWLTRFLSGASDLHSQSQYATFATNLQNASDYERSGIIMENTVMSRVDQPGVPAVSGTGAFVAAFFLAWLALIFVLGARGVFVAPRGAPPLALLIGLLAPSASFSSDIRLFGRCGSLSFPQTFASL
jgi:hypothetical protein